MSTQAVSWAARTNQPTPDPLRGEPISAVVEALMRVRIDPSFAPITLLLALLVVGCGSSGPQRQNTALVKNSEPSPVEAAGPQLVISLILDQFGANALEFHREALMKNDGLLRRILANGEQTTLRYPYAGTYTAPGHASLHTGALPNEHGVWGNRFWDVDHKKKIAWENDAQSKVFGFEDRFASPLAMRRSAVGSWLKTGKPEAKFAVISLKSRAAIASAGHAETPQSRADAVFWFDKTHKCFTSSRYYFDELPGWVADWCEEHKPDLGAWTPADPQALQEELGDDHQPGEGGWGIESTFPHVPEQIEDTMGAFITSPASSRYLIDFAAQTISEMELGEDDVADLLVLSVSGTDYVGHTFGIHSWEYRDNLLRVDRMLLAFVAALQKDRRIAVAVSSDHGSAPLPERSEREGNKASRHDHRFAEVAQKLVQKKRGKGAWVEAFVKPYLYLGEDGRKKKDAVVADLIALLPKEPEVFAAFDPREFEKLRASADEVARAAAGTIMPGQAGDVFVVPAPLHIIDDSSDGMGTAHGTPWDYDTDVPVLLLGPPLKTSLSPAPVPLKTYSEILSEWLGVHPPGTREEGPAQQNSTP